MPTAILRWFDRLFYFEVAVSAVLAVAIGFFVFSSAVMRYVLGSPIDFSDELVALLFATSSFLALPYATRRGINIRLDVLTRRFGESGQKAFALFASVAAIVIFAAFSFSAIEEIAFAIEIEEVTDVAEVPVYPFKAVVLFSTFSVLLALIANVLVGPLEAKDNEAKALEVGE